MADETDLSAEIAERAQGIVQASDEEGSARLTDVDGLIKADEYLRRRRAQSRTGLPIRVGKLIPPSALG